ncbi:hypothetical protein Emag_003436 [Eimeria magna]
MLYYMNEFLENKFQSDFDILKEHIPELLDGNTSLHLSYRRTYRLLRRQKSSRVLLLSWVQAVLKLYEFVLLISVQSEGQEVVSRFMQLDETAQGVVQRVIQFYADDDETNSFSEVAALSKNWGSSIRTPQDEEDGDPKGGPLAQRLNAQLAAAKEQLAAAKTQLAESETKRETLAEKLKTIEKERDEERDKRMSLEIQLERKKDSLVVRHKP